MASRGSADITRFDEEAADVVSRHAHFLRCFTSHEASIRAYVRRLIPARADADDVTQEVAVVLWSKFAQFRDGGDFRAWAFGVARYEVLAWMRDRGRNKLVLASDVVELLADEATVDLEYLEQHRWALRQCLDKLDQTQRSLLLESYSSQRRIQDIAQNSGRSIAGFYQWLHRMRRILLDCIKREVTHPKCP